MINPGLSKVSVVMPAHNAERTLEHSVQSVLAQTHTDIELLVCDDGSIDGTSSIIARMALEDPRIKPLRHTVARGAGSARNTCLDAAAGEYIAFLDSDDIWLPNKLEKQLNYMSVEGANFTCSHYVTFSESDDVTEVGKIIDTHRSGLFTYRDLFFKRLTLGCLTVMCEASLIGDQRMSQIRSGQDYAFWLQIINSDSCNAKMLPEVTAFYRTGQSSLSKNKFKKLKNIFTIFHSQEALNFALSVFMVFNYSVQTALLSMMATRLSKRLTGDDFSSFNNKLHQVVQDSVNG